MSYVEEREKVLGVIRRLYRERAGDRHKRVSVPLLIRLALSSLGYEVTAERMSELATMFRKGRNSR